VLEIEAGFDFNGYETSWIGYRDLCRLRSAVWSGLSGGVVFPVMASFDLELFPSNNNFTQVGRVRDNTPACGVIPR